MVFVSGKSFDFVATLLFPFVALGLSTLFESYAWTLPALLGVGLTLAGNLLLLKRS